MSMGPEYIITRDCVKYLRITDYTEHAYRKEVLLAINTQRNIQYLKEVMILFFKHAWELSPLQCIIESDKIIKVCSDIYDVYVACYNYLITQITDDEKYKHNCGYAKVYLNLLHDGWDKLYCYGEKMLKMNEIEVW